jgi:hypothetical protein
LYDYDFSALMRRLGWSGPAEELVATAEKVRRDHDLNYGAEAAETWGKAYLASLPIGQSMAELAANDSQALHLHGSLVSLVKGRQESVAPAHLSAIRVERVCGLVSRDRSLTQGWLPEADFEQFKRDVETLKGFGEEGVPILVGSAFKSECRRGNFSPSYRACPSAVVAHIHKARLAGDGLVLSETAAATVVDRNEVRCGWTHKKGKPSGRLTINASGNSVNSGNYLNSDEAKELAEQHWGPIQHPTLDQVVRMVLRAEARWGRGEIVMWKTDLKGAFTLLKFRPADVRRMTTRVDADHVYVSTQGNFGWALMGFAFAVVTRTLLVCVQALTSGLVLMYCDDLIGVGRATEDGSGKEKDWLHDRLAAVGVMRALLGDDAEETAKRESSVNSQRALVVLGWLFMLDTWSVDVSDENITKTIYLFGKAEEQRWATPKEVEAMASLAYRYSQVHPELSMLTGDLYAMNNPASRRMSRIPVEDEALMTVRLWLAFLTWSAIRSSGSIARGRDLGSFRLQSPSLVVEFDGSLTGIGFRLLVPGGAVLISVGAVSHFRIKVQGTENAAQWQNAMEMAAFACGVATAAALGYRNCAVHARGDSISALTWVTSGRNGIKSVRARAASMLFVGVCRSADLCVDKNYTWLSSADNHVCDALSRDLRGLEATKGGTSEWASPGSFVDRALALCDPSRAPASEIGFLERWEEISALTRNPLTGRLT